MKREKDLINHLQEGNTNGAIMMPNQRKHPSHTNICNVISLSKIYTNGFSERALKSTQEQKGHLRKTKHERMHKHLVYDNYIFYIGQCLCTTQLTTGAD